MNADDIDKMMAKFIIKIRAVLVADLISASTKSRQFFLRVIFFKKEDLSF